MSIITESNINNYKVVNGDGVDASIINDTVETAVNAYSNSQTAITTSNEAVNTANLAEEKIDEFIKTEGNSVVTLNGVPQVTWSADFAESERLKSLNLFSSDISLGWYNGSSGRVAHSEVLSNTNLIDVLPNETYYLSTSSDVKITDIVFYNNSIYNYVNYSIIGETSFSFTVPSNANKIGVNFNTGTITNVMLTLGNKSVPYQPYSGQITHNGDAPVVFAESERQKSKNLLPVMSTAEVITIGENGLITFNGNVGAWTYDIFIGEIYLKKGKTYTLSIQNYSGTGKQLFTFQAKKVSDGTAIRDYLYTYDTKGRVTPTEDIILTSGGFYFSRAMTVNFSCFVQIEEGDVVTDYQPYNGAIVHEKELLNKIYPIGSIYLSVNEVSPASIFGGTWEKIQDKFLLASGSYALGSEGGSTSHNHSLNNGFAKIGYTWTYERNDTLYVKMKSGVSFVPDCQTSNDTGYDQGGLDMGSGTELGGTTDTTSTLPPYLVVNIWKRVA